MLIKIKNNLVLGIFENGNFSICFGLFEFIFSINQIYLKFT